tara:strand:+ start:412 stop:627 length:216 start_codon:yes stop_codon:yes gene_type:complete
MKRYEYKFDDDQVITLKGKGLKQAIRQYRQENPKQLKTKVTYINKNGQFSVRNIKLREVNIGVDRHGNLIR